MWHLTWFGSRSHRYRIFLMRLVLCSWRWSLVLLLKRCFIRTVVYFLLDVCDGRALDFSGTGFNWFSWTSFITQHRLPWKTYRHSFNPRAINPKYYTNMYLFIVVGKYLSSNIPFSCSIWTLKPVWQRKVVKNALWLTIIPITCWQIPFWKKLVHLFQDFFVGLGRLEFRCMAPGQSKQLKTDIIQMWPFLMEL